MTSGRGGNREIVLRKETLSGDQASGIRGRTDGDRLGTLCETYFFSPRKLIVSKPKRRAYLTWVEILGESTKVCWKNKFLFLLSPPFVDDYRGKKDKNKINEFLGGTIFYVTTVEV